MLNPVFSLVINLCPHIVHHEWLSEVVFIVWEWHCFEMKSHHCSCLNISKLVFTSSGVWVYIEEFSHRCSVFREIWVIESLIPLLIVINDMISFRSEQFIELFILKDLIKNPNLVHCWLCSLVSNSCKSGQCEKTEVNFPNEGLVQHQKCEWSIANQGSGPAIVWSVQSIVDLI